MRTVLGGTTGGAPYTPSVTTRALGQLPGSDALPRILRDRQRLADVGLAAAYAAIFLGYTVLQLGTKVIHLPWVAGPEPQLPGLQPTIVLFSRASVAFVIVCAVALAWRRSRPELSFLVIGAVGLLQIAVGEPIRLWDIALPIGLFSAAAYAGRTFARLALVGALLSYVAVWSIEVGLLGRLTSLPNPVDFLTSTRGASFAVVFALLVVVWAIGDQVRSGRERLEREVERAEELAREGEATARIGTLAERQRIARELHDVVAHGLSVMIVQADGALYAEAEHPEAPRRALETIASTGRDSLHEMRRLLGVLRDEPTAGKVAPPPELASLPQLIDGFRAAGLDIAYREEGSIRPLPPAVGLTAYRVVQESLTNALHHAGPTHVDVRVDFRLEALGLVVANEPGAAAAIPSPAAPGLGLLGMRERVSLLGGRMTAGPTSSGGFRVQVELPIERPAS